MSEPDGRRHEPRQCIYAKRGVRCPNTALADSIYCDQHLYRAIGAVGGGGRLSFTAGALKRWINLR
jgi:hypothetical protein